VRACSIASWTAGQRTATELAVVADVTPSTASVHLRRLLGQRLVTLLAQGKHRYYSLNGAAVADALEALSVLAGTRRDEPRQNASHHRSRKNRSLLRTESR
jgi:DNA-binding transcriptional ArsR family regulator